jgi:hypothetical protein
VRCVVTIENGTDNRVEGWVQADSLPATRTFCGWLELMAILEAVPGAPDPARGHGADEISRSWPDARGLTCPT